MDHLPVYLVHWNAPEWCRDAVSSVMASTGVSVEVTVIDNGHEVGLDLASVLPPGTRVLSMAVNRGYAGGANAALRDWRERFAECELVVIGSHDLHVEPATLRRLLDVATARPDAGIVAPVLLAPFRWAGGGWNGRSAWQYKPEQEIGTVERDWSSGTCLVLRRACVEKVGDFDEDLGSYLEDVDYGLRVNDAGWKVVVALDASAHGVGSVTRDVTERITTNSVLLAAKRTGARGAAVAAAFAGAAAIRGWLAGLAPWRDRPRRAISTDFARQRSRALVGLTHDPALRRVLRASGGRS